MGLDIIPTSTRYETIGAIRKTVKDVAYLLKVLVDYTKTEVLEGDYGLAMTTS